MAGKSFQRLEGGKEKAVQAVTVSAGAGNDGDVIGLDATGKIDLTMMPIGVGPDLKSVPSTEDLAAGDYVNLFDDAGTVKTRLADNSNGRPAHGFVIAATVSPAVNSVYFEGANSNLSGLTLGARYYLGTVGQPTATPLEPIVGTGKIHQYLGMAISATEINTDIQDCVELV